MKLPDISIPVRMVLTGVGGVDHGKLTSMAEKYFGDVKNEYKQKIPPEKTAGIRFTGAEMTYRDDYVPWMYTAAAVEGVGLGHPDSVPLMVANAYVGQWDSSQSTSVNSPIPLAQKISTMPGIQAYQSFNINYRNTGLFGVYYVMDGKNLKETFAVATEFTREWKYLATSCRDADLDRAKNILKTNIFQALESSAARADDIARQVLYYGHHLPQHELEKMIDNVDAKDMRRAMMAHVYDRDLAAGGYGRVEAFMPYLMMRYSMSWWRM